MPVDYKQLTEDLKEARRLAKVAADSVEDGGSCNLDHLRLYTGKDWSIPRVSDKLRRAIQEAGCSLGTDKVRGSYDLNIGGYHGGQASKRYYAVQAAYNYLRGRGWPVTVYYIMG